MRSVKAKTSELLGTIRANLEKHRAEYAEAFEGYKLEAQEALKVYQAQVQEAVNTVSKRVQESEQPRDKPVMLLDGLRSVPLPTLRVPEDHSKDYEVVIRMLEFETQPTIDIDADQFECYVMDRWEWKDDFAVSHERYSKSLKMSQR